MKNKKKLLSMILAVVIIVGAAGTALGAGNYITKKIWQGPITMYRNNQPVQLGVSPLIMDGTTYVPVRAMAQLLGLNITWDNPSRSIFITDNTQANMAQYAQLLAVQEAKEKEYKKQIEQLEADKKNLQTQLEEAKKKARDDRDDRDLYGLKQTLNRSYSSANIDGQRLTFDYGVRETSRSSYGKYTMTIEMDVRGNDKNYSLKDSREFFNFLENNVAYEAVRYNKDYKNRTYYDYIDIVVTDRDNRGNDCTFSVDSDGRVR